MNTRAIGTLAEQIAKDFLIEKGYTIVTANFYARQGEIDLIAKTDEFLVFIEVKYRKDISFATGIENITPTKIRRILKTANYYLYRHHLYDHNIRFDVIEIHGEDFAIHHIENAFTA